MLTIWKLCTYLETNGNVSSKSQFPAGFTQGDQKYLLIRVTIIHRFDHVDPILWILNLNPGVWRDEDTTFCSKIKTKVAQLVRFIALNDDLEDVSLAKTRVKQFSIKFSILKPHK